MVNEIQDLLKLGLTDGEAKVYLALTELGSSKVGPIVKKSGVAYSNLYDVLRRLIDKGIVSFITKNKTKYFQAVSPANLVDYLEKKEKEIIKQKEALKLIVPKLEKLQETAPKQDAEIFIGKKGLKTAYLKMLSDLSNKDEHLFLYTHEEEFAKESDLFYLSIKEELKKHKLRGISNKAYAKSQYVKQSKHLQLKFVNTPLPGNIDICKDKILHVSWKKPTIAIIIHSEDVADNMRKYFKQLWKTATP